MKRFLTILFFLLFGLSAFAQENLTISLNPVEQSSVNWDLSLSLDARSEFYIEIPSGMRFIPTTIEVADQQFWLQNTIQVPPRESVVSWSADPNGIVFRFRDSDTPPGAEIRISGVLSLVKKEVLNTELFQIKTVTGVTEEAITTDQVIATAALPVSISK
jgi:hypothetical protein